ncbi:MAG: sigma-54 dependent transcriptional regulator [Polyangiaceae bacterium]
MTASPRILLIDDDVNLRGLIEDELTKRGYTVVVASSAEEGLQRIAREDVAVVLTDVNMGGIDGIKLCERALAIREDLPVIVMTAFGTMDTAIAAIRAGAYDFVTKPFAFDSLVMMLDRALKLNALRGEVRALRKRVEQKVEEPTRMIGESPTLQKMQDLLQRIALTESTVLITGESGTGKELVAQAVHEQSPRRGGPFVAINCAAMPEPLLESELFGHAKGAFTDARNARIGLFVKANGGTLLLDEIGEMPLGMQAKLLRALQERTVRPVGSDIEVPFDARIVAATHRDLEAQVAQKLFREDLFYRINVVRVHVPPLRARGNDILALATFFLHRIAAQSHREGLRGFSSAVTERLLSYSWPGNVRELQNCIERAVALARGEYVALEDLPDKVRQYRADHIESATAATDPASMPTMEEVERRYVRQVLDAVSGNKTLAAQILGFDRRTLYRKLERNDGSNGHTTERGVLAAGVKPRPHDASHHN